MDENAITNAIAIISQATWIIENSACKRQDHTLRSFEEAKHTRACFGSIIHSLSDVKTRLHETEQNIIRCHNQWLGPVPFGPGKSLLQLLHNLPHDIMIMIFRLLGHDDLKQCRLASKSMGWLVSPFLFTSVAIHGEGGSLNLTMKLVKQFFTLPVANHVQSLRICLPHDTAKASVPACTQLEKHEKSSFDRNLKLQNPSVITAKAFKKLDKVQKLSLTGHSYQEVDGKYSNTITCLPILAESDIRDMLPRMTALRELSLSYMALGDNIVCDLAQCTPYLQHFEISGLKGGWRHYCQFFSTESRSPRLDLRTIEINRCRFTSGDVSRLLPLLIPMRSLQRVEIILLPQKSWPSLFNDFVKMRGGRVQIASSCTAGYIWRK